MEFNTLNEVDEQIKFEKRTDRRSLRNQIKTLVAAAHEIYQNELEIRRIKLKNLLDEEDRQYENEFVKKVRKRIAEDLQERRLVLLKLKNESRKQEEVNLHMRIIRRNIKNCSAVRDKISQKEKRNAMECQWEQMCEKAREEHREREIDRQWREIFQCDEDYWAEMQKKENCLKKCQTSFQHFVWNLQIEDKQNQIEIERLEKIKDGKILDSLAEEIRLENLKQFERIGVTPPHIRKYGEELRQQMDEKKQRELCEKIQNATDHKEMCEQIQRLEVEEQFKFSLKKRGFYRETLEFLTYLKRMRCLESKRDQISSHIIDDLQQTDFCLKNERQRILTYKAKVAAEAHAVLKKQVCEEYERRLREQNELKQNKILINTFVRNEPTNADVVAKKQRYQLELLKQIQDIKNYRAEEERNYENSLKRAQTDPNYCEQMAEKYAREGTDYLSPHLNWYILTCPTMTNVVPKEKQQWSYCEGPIKPCGCEAKWQQTTC